MYDFTKCSHNRDAYGKALVELGYRNTDVIVLDSDLSSSTKTEHFKKAYPERFFDLGIAEQNLMGVAAGLALSGKIPYVSTFAIFGTGRGWEQIRNTIAYDNLNVKLVFTHAGFSLGGDGGTHQSLEDIAIMRVIPNMHVIIPADITETRSVIHHIAEQNGPHYVRLSRRRTLELFNPDDYIYNPTEYPVLEEGSDVTIFTHGGMIRYALEACYQLRKLGISLNVVNMHTIKPISSRCIIHHAKKTGYVITLEEHNVMGGLGSAVAEVLCQNKPVPMKIMGVQDQFGMSGPVNSLHEYYGLSTQRIVQEVHNIFAHNK